MKQLVVNFKSAKVVNIKKIFNQSGKKLKKIQVKLDWFEMGVGTHDIFKSNGMYFFTDKLSPIPCRKFSSIEALAWEYELDNEVVESIKLLK